MSNTTKNQSGRVHNLRVVTFSEAHDQGFQSITVGIHSKDEREILASVCQHRDPERAVLIKAAPDTYELAIKREDVARHEEDHRRDP